LVNATNTDALSNIGETPFFIFTIANNTGIEVSADSCTYTSGDWNVDITDNCVINSEVIGDSGKCVVFTGDGGTFTVNAKISGFACVKYLTTNSKYLLNKGGVVG